MNSLAENGEKKKKKRSCWHVIRIPPSKPGACAKPVLTYLRRRDCIEAIVLVMAEEGASCCPDSAPKSLSGRFASRALWGGKLGRSDDKKEPHVL